MFKLLAAPTLLVCLVASPLFAQGPIVVFGGYSYLRPPVTAWFSSVCPVGTFPGCPPSSTITNDRNLNGFELSGTYRCRPAVGIAVDFRAHYGSAAANASGGVHQYTGLAGPEFAFPSRVSPSLTSSSAARIKP